ncbi:MAG: hypothetical protein KAQ91_00285 [Methylococcales bacterium]|nr:hypothetical protein [Methylococcales bacterium]
MKNAIIYLHGFNSASLDLAGDLLASKQKLVVLERFCQQHKIKFYTPNVDYRDFEQVISDLTQSFLDIEAEGYKVFFMGSSLGGFTSEYMAIKTQRKAIMINPAIEPAELLVQFIGVSENFELKQPYDWTQAHCDQYRSYENALKQASDNLVNRIILLDMADELIDSYKTQKQYAQRAEIIAYEGGSHSFEHIEEALSVIEKVIHT